jgi:hypothetical protein
LVFLLIVTLLFALLGFPFHDAFLFQKYILSINALLFALLCSPFHAAIVGVLLFVEKSCTTPLHSFFEELGLSKVENPKPVFFQ